ncbi:hypothetical protein [Lysinibacillus sp. SGAir0095]|uniref:hypothetical protein n=1 Tax=Lysinibacillus sp. SGAir0095 TaxID=2070463 RepID=UPI0010CCF71E|nr:hypothetical protein [Lysinibacillus sp. SGAir0095]QCR31911.1 hypothetical protein C1N55_06840 [Lysinibacillus sp. SGAir0095]
MSLIAQHPYIKIERKMTSIEKFEIEHDRIIYLYNDKVVTQNREFPIKDVMDFSYREIANQGGILYLHALQGVYTYIVKSSPEAFITAYRAYFK